MSYQPAPALQEPAPAPTPAPAPQEPASEDEIVELLAALPSRVDGLEASQRQQLSDDMELRGTVATLNSRVSDHSISISNNQGRLNALTQDIQNTQAKQLEHEAVVDSRFKPLEEAAARRLIIEVRQPNAAPVIHTEGPTTTSSPCCSAWPRTYQVPGATSGWPVQPVPARLQQPTR
jgi:uncharacterized coiled-coil protein SlyX